ncbi:MAG: VOC family protein [Candidatus Binataceae bacterium]
MATHGIDHINLSASGQRYAALRQFYCDVLGLAAGARPPLRSAGLWLYAGGAPIVHLVELSAQEDAAAQDTAASGLDHVALRCDDLDRTLQRLRSLGVPHVVNEANAAGQVLVRLRDPADLTLELVFEQGE